MKVKYDKIGVNYNQTRRADPYLTSRLLHLLSPKVKGLYLDIGCGTGNYTHEFQQNGFSFIGIDPSMEMLDKAQKRNPKIDWRLGTAEETMLPEDSIDGIIASFTIHHWNSLENGCRALGRALKAGGRFVILTATPQQMEGYWLNDYFPQMLKDSMEQMPSYEAIELALTKAGLIISETEFYNVQPDLKDQFLYCGKQHPERYFDPAIRHGISSFSALANREEIEKGLQALRADIDTGKIEEVMQSYENELGDYLFVVARKI